MTDIIHNDKIGHKELKKALDSVENTIGYALGGRDDVSVVFKNKEGENDVLSSSLKLLLRDTHDISKHYFRQFTDLNHIDTALDKLKHINTAKTVFAMTIACATCFSAQPIIRKITKKMTGKDEFPVYDNVRKQYEQKSDKAATPSFKGKTSVLRKLGLEFNDKFPNVRHFALVFVVQAMGRLFAARDKNEFRETFTRDSLGGINWLILGGLMGKLIIRYSKYKDKLWKAPAREEGQSAFKTLKNFLFKSKVVSYKELNDMKEYALRHPEGKTEPEINKLFHALKLRKCIASSVGILWPCIALGVLIPLYNIHRTNKVEAKKLAGEGFVEKPEYKNKKPAFSAATSNTGVFNKFTQKMGKA